MKIVSVINQKGGAGKTTVALHLAVASSRAGLNTAVIDLDPQASSAHWGDRRQAQGPVVRSAHASRLPQELQQIQAAGGEWVVVDTAPHADSAALAAAEDTTVQALVAEALEMLFQARGKAARARP